MHSRIKPSKEAWAYAIKEFFVVGLIVAIGAGLLGVFMGLRVSMASHDESIQKHIEYCKMNSSGRVNVKWWRKEDGKGHIEWVQCFCNSDYWTSFED